MDSDIAEKMKNILCQDHNKKIQFLNLEMGARTFFICADCLTKNKKYCIDKMDYFVSIEDFKSVYLNRMKRELEQLKENIGTTQIQIENHIKNGETNIEDQYENMIKVLTQHIKNVIRAYKQSLIQKFRDAHRTNLKALEVTTEQINMMLDDNTGILKRLDSTMNRQIENSAVLQKLLQEFLDQKKAYQANVDQLKLTSASFSFKDLICEFKSDKQFAEHKNKVLKEKLNSVFMSEIGTEDYREAVIHKSNRSVKELKLESRNLFECADFDRLKKGKLTLIGGFQTSKHSSHHILSATNLNNSFLVTGHSDSTFKIWFLNPSYFQTPFTQPSIKQASSKDLIEEDFTKTVKKPNGVKPFELVFVSATDEFHKHYVTALCSFDRMSDKRKILVSGDSGGELIVSEISYHSTLAKLERVDVIFKERSKHGQITKIEKFLHDDIVVVASQDGSFTFWDIEKGQPLLTSTEHEEPVLSLQFMDDYNYLCSATKHDLVVWSVRFEEKAGNRGYRDGSEMPEDKADKGERFTIYLQVVSSIEFDEKGSSFSTAKLFATNLAYDYLLFVSVGSDIKLFNILSGKFIGVIDGAHFKGTTNFGIILNSGPSSKLKGTLNRINSTIPSGKQKDIFSLFVEQLNDYLIVSTSSKDKLRVWQFEDVRAVPISQAACLGGMLDSQIFTFYNRDQEVCLLVCGNCSNKIEIFTLTGKGAPPSA